MLWARLTIGRLIVLPWMATGPPSYPGIAEIFQCIHREPPHHILLHDRELCFTSLKNYRHIGKHEWINAWTCLFSVIWQSSQRSISNLYRRWYSSHLTGFAKVNPTILRRLTQMGKEEKWQSEHKKLLITKKLSQGLILILMICKLWGTMPKGDECDAHTKAVHLCYAII